MAPSGDLLFLTHNVSSVNVDFKGHLPSFQELRSRSLESCKTSINSLLLVPTTMNQGDSVKDPKLKNSESAETDPVAATNNPRFNQYISMKFRRKVHNFKNHPYVLNCNQSQCPALKERLEHHRCANYRHRARTYIMKKYKEQGINVTPTWSRLNIPQIAQLLVSDGKSVQTEITLEDFILQQECLTDTLNYLKDLTLKGNETEEDLPVILNFYKDSLQNEIINWLQNVPIFYSLDFTTEYLKENIITVFLDRIMRMIGLVNEESYATSVKAEIDECLNILPMWLPNSPQEQILFKNSLRDKLYNKIETLNTKIIKQDFKVNEKENKDNNKKPLKGIENKEVSCLPNLYTKVVASWLSKVKFNRPISKKHVTDIIVKKISSLLNEPLHTRICKTKLKSEILDILDTLPINLLTVKNRNVHLNQFSEELANRLLSTRAKLGLPENRAGDKFGTQITRLPIYNNQIKHAVHETVSKVLGKTKLIKKCNIDGEVHNVILNSLETLRSGINNNISSEICDVLTRTCNITEERAMKVAKKIKLYMKIALKHNKVSKRSSFHPVRPQLSGTMTIYRSNESGPVTSTPKKSSKKDTPRLNLEEKAYMKNVADLIRAWMEMLPKKFDDDKQYKETIINDLAGDIMDEVKREQLSPECDTEKDKHIHYFVYRWVARFEFFDDLNDATPLIDQFLIKLKQVPEPKLTGPQHGTRQAMHNLQHIEKENGWDENFVPRGIDILEDQISVWMNEQPSEMYVTDSRRNRDKVIKDLALRLQDHLRSKHSEDEISEEIKQWLKQVIKPQEKEHLPLLTQYLKDKIIHLPQDDTLEARNQKRMRQRAEYRQNVISTASPESDEAYSIQEDPEETMKEFIIKYVEHNYDIDDSMAKGAFCQLLKTELRKLNPSKRQELYDNFPRNKLFTAEQFANQLEYISMISDWLKNIPINPLYNTPGNRARVDFVNDLARNIQEAEEQRKEYSDGMDYDLFLSSVISISLRTYNIPILPEHTENIPLMINQLLSKIIAKRSLTNQDDTVSSGVAEQNLSEFIDQYIRINNREVTDDEIKREAWTARLLKEVNKIVHEQTDPSKLTKAQVYERLRQVPMPSKASVRRFSLEMNYIKEISDWLKNLPLLSITDLPDAENERIRMISELAEKITEREAQRSSDPNDNTAEKKLVEYITNWISKLPLDPRKNVVVPILIQQLMNRIERVSRKNMTLPDSFQEPTSPYLDVIVNNDESIRDPGTYLVDWIENWCNKLPIQGNEQDLIKNKQEIARKLYQKIGELNVNPRIYNDDTLYRSLLEDEIDTIFENLPQNPELQSNRNNLKAELLNNILTIKTIIGQNLAGDNYKHKLETTIDAAIPNPVQNRQTIEPGFEMYKKHLANMFILENFDHSEDYIKYKYEKRIRDEIDKYFESALNKNALPMTKTQMYNELYSELFKVPMPSEDAVVDQVEEVKTRCEIDAWFHDLPLREASSVGEYLECDQILSTLAKRIHDIEKYESDPDEKIHKEIRKWLQKLPLLSPQQSNIDDYVNQLQSTLNSSVEARRYVSANSNEPNQTRRKSRTEPISNMSELAGVCDKNKKCTYAATSYKRPGDLIVEVVENWCNEIELAGDDIQNKLIKDNLSTKIVMKVCKLNIDARILNDDILYDQLLDDELEKCLSDLPTSHRFHQSNSDKKQQLIEMIRAIRPLVKETNKKHEYKTELNNTITSILNGYDRSAEKSLEFNKVKEEIIDNFVQFYYNQGNEEAKQIYKRNLHDAVIEYMASLNNKDKQLDSLVQRNQLVCELLKVPAPNSSVLKDEVDEIKLKHEVEQFFDENLLNDKTEKTMQIKKLLAKRLNEIEKSGHNDFNDAKMKSEIARCLNKLNIELNPEVIKKFVNKLKNNETERTRPANNVNHDKYPSARSIDGNILTPQEPLFYRGNSNQSCMTPQTRQHQQGQFLQVPPHLDWSHCRSDPQWVSLESATPRNGGSVYYEPSGVQQFGSDLSKTWNNREESQLGLGNYKEFERGTVANSTFIHQENGVSQSPKRHILGSGMMPMSRVHFESCQTCPSNQHGNGTVSDRNLPHNFGGSCQWSNQNRSQLQENSQNCQPSPNQQFYTTPSQAAQQNQNELLNYNEYRRSYGVSPRSPNNVSQTSFRGPCNGNTIRPYASSISDGRSFSDAASYRKIVTPRRVQGEALVYEPSAPQNAVPDSQFPTPIIVPRHLSSRLSLLSGNPSCSSRGLRPTFIPSGRSFPSDVKRASRCVEPPGGISPCMCGSRKKCKTAPYCMVPMEEYCDECGGYSPTWCRMPIHGCFYMQCILQNQ